ncbi:sigma-54-dependent transcriptional regulator [Aquisalibacillus elongatus]|uniref:Sigma-54 interacting transcriptional regulator n=1 Tax=Aquisalibacillus elongatus TaxID=485577 RepID=A0A3N5B860_9BACI|nr:sigma-54-dependent transcriptional regulator [Aquisalibacillus elongatus]RPF53926.1 sigma-54 interacting transcriptional regulator [Aquisalibacillus elongatus]
MKVKVMFIAPYAAMVPLVEECKADLAELDISLEVGNLQDGVEIAKRAEAEGYHVIISRGGTAKMIRHAVSLPVVDVHITGYDILRILTLAKDFSEKKALVGFTNITLGAQSIADVLDYPVDVYSIQQADDVKELLPKLKEDGYGLILGDVITVEEANRHGMEGVLLQSGREAIYSSFSKAEQQYVYHRSNLDRIELLTQRLKGYQENLLILNQKGHVVHEVWSSFEGVPISVEALEDLKEKLQLHGSVSEFIPTLRGKEVEVFGYMANVDRSSYMVFTFSLNINSFNHLSGVEVKMVNQKPKVIHKSDAMNRALKVIDQSFYQHQLYVLNGDPGSGKSLFAEYIHYKSQVSDLLVVVDFNQCKVEDLKRILSSNVKTIYCQNVDDHPSENKLELMKSFLYRIMDQQVRVIFSSKPAWLYELVFDHERLVEVHVPSLREREEDLKELVTMFMTEFNQSFGSLPIRIKDEAVKVLANQDWPYNVRELKSFIKTLVLSEKGYVIEAHKVKSMLSEKKSQEARMPMLEGTLDEIESRVIEAVLEEENFNQSKTAKRLGINRSTLWRKLNK